MSVTEHGSPAAPPQDPYDEWGDGPAAYSPGDAPRRAGNDRTQPQDNAAEQSVLGSMLLSKDAIADVTEVIRGTDFYRPAHELIHDAIIDLYGRGEPADMVMKRHRVFFRDEDATGRALRRWTPAMLATAIARLRAAERGVMAPGNAGPVLADEAVLTLTRALARRG